MGALKGKSLDDVEKGRQSLGVNVTKNMKYGGEKVMGRVDSLEICLN